MDKVNLFHLDNMIRLNLFHFVVQFLLLVCRVLMQVFHLPKSLCRVVISPIRLCGVLHGFNHLGRLVFSFVLLDVVAQSWWIGDYASACKEGLVDRSAEL